MSNTHTNANTADIKNSPNRLTATIFGAIYLLVGLLGFTVAGGVDFFAQDGNTLFGMFEVNPFHNVVHLLVGAVLLFAGLKTVRAAKSANTTIGAVYLALGLVGLFILDSAANILALNSGDNILHFATALILLAVGLGTEKHIRDNHSTGTTGSDTRSPLTTR